MELMPGPVFTGLFCMAAIKKAALLMELLTSNQENLFNQLNRCPVCRSNHFQNISTGYQPACKRLHNGIGSFLHGQSKRLHFSAKGIKKRQAILSLLLIKQD
jgi:hypothetical protein